MSTKHGKSHYGSKNHVNGDRMHNLVRRCHVPDGGVYEPSVMRDFTALGPELQRYCLGSAALCCAKCAMILRQIKVPRPY